MKTKYKLIVKESGNYTSDSLSSLIWTVFTVQTSELFQRTDDLVVFVRFRFGFWWVRVAAIVLGGERKLVLVAFTEDAEVLRIVFFRIHPWSQVWLRGFARVLCRCGFVIFVVPRIDGVYRANHGGEVPDLQRVPKEGE